jgi:DNA modification methylase
VTPWLDDGDVRLYLGDNLDVLRQLPDRSVHMCATSPPFYGLRDYSCEGQIGLEDTPDQWVERLVAVFREVRRVLRDDGTLWVEIGDSYSGGHSGYSVFDQGRNDGREGYATDVPAGRIGRPPVPGRKPKDLLGQPWLLAKALRDPYYAGTIKNENDRVWLAAMVDAEGSIGIHKRPAGTSAYSSFEKKDGTTSEYVRKTDSYQPKVEITNTSRAIMDRVVAIAGGNCDTKQAAGTHGRKQTIYRWTLTADKCRDLLREVYPHLVGKQHEARLAIGCPSSGEKATAAHEALKLLHGGSTTGIDFPAPESLWEAGWYLRSEIIWSRLRPNPMPESVTDRPTKAHSTVFLLSKQPRYYFDQDAIREPYSPHSDFGNDIPAEPMPSTVGDSVNDRRIHARLGNGSVGGNHSGANARSVWTIPTQPTPFAHFATWPEALCRRMILAGTSERGCCPECGAPWVRDVEVHGESDYARILRETGKTYKDLQAEAIANGITPGNVGQTHDPGSRGTSYTIRERTTHGWVSSCDHDRPPVPCTVLDPFAGSATTMLVARNHGRHSIGIELNEDYLQIAAKRLQQLSLFSSPNKEMESSPAPSSTT